MSSTDDEHAHPWKKSAWEARETARLMFLNLRPEHNKSQALFAPDTQVQLHNAVIDYASHVSPVSSSVQRAWSEEIDVVTVPQDGVTHHAGRTDRWGEYDMGSIIPELPKKRLTVSLDTLREQWHMDNFARVEVVLDDGDIRDARRLDYHLPIRTASAVFQQIDHCIAELNWLPERQPDRDIAAPSAIPDHVRADAPAYDGQRENSPDELRRDDE